MAPAVSKTLHMMIIITIVLLSVSHNFHLKKNFGDENISQDVGCTILSSDILMPCFPIIFAKDYDGKQIWDITMLLHGLTPWMNCE